MENHHFLNDSKVTTSSIYFQGIFTKGEASKILGSCLILWIFALIMSFKTPRLVRESGLFYPYTPENTETSYNLSFKFKPLSYYHRFMHVETSFVRHHEGKLPEKELVNHVTEWVSYGKENLLVYNLTEKNYTQKIHFAENDFAGSNNTFFINDFRFYNFAEVNFIYQTDFSEIAGFNIYYSHGNYNIQCFLEVVRLSLVLCVVFSTLSYHQLITEIKESSTFRKTTFLLGILGVLSLNPFTLFLRYPILNLLTPILEGLFLLYFRVYSLYILNLYSSRDNSISFIEKIFKLYIYIYSVLEIKEIYNQVLPFYHYKSDAFEKTPFSWIIILMSFIYGVVGFLYLFKIYRSHKSNVPFHFNWSFSVTFFVFTLTVFTTMLVNSVFNAILIRPIGNSVMPSLLYHFTYILALLVFQHIACTHDSEIERFVSKKTFLLF